MNAEQLTHGRLCFVTVTTEDVPPESPKGKLGAPLRIRSKSASPALWRSGQGAVALLYRPQPLGTDGELIAAARVVARPRGGNQPHRRLDFLRADRLPQPITVSELANALPRDVWQVVESSIRSGATPLPPTIGVAIIQALRRIAPHAIPAIEALSAEVVRALTLTQIEKRDRVSTVMRMFGSNLAAAKPETPDAADLKIGKRLPPIWEKDTIEHDGMTFPEWDFAEKERYGWLRFKRGDDRQLLVKNIDAKAGENDTGGDIVYLRLDPDAITLVQYKRSDERRAQHILYCAADARFTGQIARLTAWSPPVSGLPDLVSISAYRLAASPGYVKIVDHKPEYPGTEDMYKGYYLPAEYVQQLLEESDGGGLTLNTKKDRYIDSTSFVQLVANRWIGTHGPLGDDLFEKLYLDAVLDERRSATVAVERPLIY